MACTDILHLTLAHDVNLLRRYMAQQTPYFPLLHSLIIRFVHDPAIGVQSQASEILKLLLDNDEAAGEDIIVHNFLTVFYRHFMPLLVACIDNGGISVKKPLGNGEGQTLSRSASREHISGRADLAAGFVQGNVCEMLAFCVQHHPIRVKPFLLQTNAVQVVLKLLAHRDTFLVLASLRFFRAFVGAKDEDYNQHIVRNNLFAPVVTLFTKNGPKKNLVRSTTLELFDFARRENVKLLIPYLVENFGDMMRKVGYVAIKTPT